MIEIKEFAKRYMRLRCSDAYRLADKLNETLKFNDFKDFFRNVATEAQYDHVEFNVKFDTEAMARNDSHWQKVKLDIEATTKRESDDFGYVDDALFYVAIELVGKDSVVVRSYKPTQSVYPLYLAMIENSLNSYIAAVSGRLPESKL